MKLPSMSISRTLLFLFVSSLLLPLCSTARARPPAGQNWVLNPHLSDEFRSERLDTSKWRPKHAWYAGKPPSRFSEGDVWVEGGSLKIGATPLPGDQQTAKVWMTTGCISSLLPIAGFGYYEARIKASPSPLDSAFFLQIRSGQEIDIAENFGGSRTTPALGWQARSHTHWFPNGYRRENDTDSLALLSVPNTEWHVYGVWLQNATTAIFYVDNRKVATHHLKGRFAKPMYMFFDQEPSQFQGLPKPAELVDKPKFTMQVDWVRSYVRT